MNTYNTRQTIDDALLPSLRHGLHELLVAAQADRQLMASGTEWKDGNWRPRDYKPFNPQRWLADWLDAHAGSLTTQHAGNSDVEGGLGALGTETADGACSFAKSKELVQQQEVGCMVGDGSEANQHQHCELAAAGVEAAVHAEADHDDGMLAIS